MLLLTKIKGDLAVHDPKWGNVIGKKLNPPEIYHTILLHLDAEAFAYLLCSSRAQYATLKNFCFYQAWKEGALAQKLLQYVMNGETTKALAFFERNNSENHCIALIPAVARELGRHFKAGQISVIAYLTYAGSYHLLGKMILLIPQRFHIQVLDEIQKIANSNTDLRSLGPLKALRQAYHDYLTILYARGEHRQALRSSHATIGVRQGQLPAIILQWIIHPKIVRQDNGAITYDMADSPSEILTFVDGCDLVAMLPKLAEHYTLCMLFEGGIGWLNITTRKKSGIMSFSGSFRPMESEAEYLRILETQLNEMLDNIVQNLQATISERISSSSITM